MNSFAIGLVWLALLLGLSAINDSLKLIHQAIRDTNHAPTVVTQYVDRVVFPLFKEAVTNDAGVEK